MVSFPVVYNLITTVNMFAYIYIHIYLYTHERSYVYNTYDDHFIINYIIIKDISENTHKEAPQINSGFNILKHAWRAQI